MEKNSGLRKNLNLKILTLKYDLIRNKPINLFVLKNFRHSAGLKTRTTRLKREISGVSLYENVVAFFYLNFNRNSILTLLNILYIN